MKFPFFYTGELVVYKPRDYDQAYIAQQIKALFSATDDYAQGYRFNAPFSYTKLPINGILWVDDDNTSITFRYKVSLFESNLVLLLALVFAGFFYQFNDATFAIGILMAGIVLYFFNTLKIINTLQKVLIKIMGVSPDLGEHKLWQMQQQWLENPLVCPACGEAINHYADRCINCGLGFKINRKQYSTTNSTGAQSINFHFKKGE